MKCQKLFLTDRLLFETFSEISTTENVGKNYEKMFLWKRQAIEFDRNMTDQMKIYRRKYSNKVIVIN